ncbi:MAG: dihydropteroate synthase, partial [Solirubrobacterales bacterium]
IGFGKSLEHNLELLGRLDEIAAIGFPVVAGLSRKRFLGAITGREEPAAWVAASVAAAVLAWERGASVLRAHDVAATVDGLKVAAATLGAR